MHLFLGTAYWGPLSPALPHLSKLDAGLRCLTDSVKLWCGCLILVSMHLAVFTIIIFKKVEEIIWMEQFISASPDQWCVEDGWSVRNGDLRPPDFQSHIQRDGSAWWVVVIGKKELKEACHCSHLLLFVCILTAPTFIWWHVLWPWFLNFFLSKLDSFSSSGLIGNTLQLIIISVQK